MSAYTDNDPLFGDVPLHELRMVLQCKAVVSARRHLVREHGVVVDDVQGSAMDLARLHHGVHGADARAARRLTMPWQILQLPNASPTTV